MSKLFYFSFFALAAGFAYDSKQAGLCAALSAISIIILFCGMMEYLSKGKVS